MNKATEIATKIIKLNEGCKLEVYTCPAGKPTFGYGTNLEVLDGVFKDDENSPETVVDFTKGVESAIRQINNLNDKDKKGLAEDFAFLEIVNCKRALRRHSWFTNDLSEFQQAIILDLAYNIGVAGVLKFQKMIAAIKQHNYGIACTEMLDSKYHYQMICYGYAKELAKANIDTSKELQVYLWWCDLDNDNKQLRSACNAGSLQCNKPLGKYKGLF
jgi:lysozyme